MRQQCMTGECTLGYFALDLLCLEKHTPWEVTQFSEDCHFSDLNVLAFPHSKRPPPLSFCLTPSLSFSLLHFFNDCPRHAGSNNIN